MNTRAIVLSAIGLLSICAISIFLWTAIHAFFYVPDTEISIPPSAQSPISSTASKPKRLLIPSLKIDANIQYAGITAKNAMGTPNNFRDVAWYKYGPIPGQRGSAVIDGHVDNALALPGVFKNLHNIKAGDDVYVTAEDGSRLHFMVVSSTSYPYDNAPTDLIFGQNDIARLNLITCSGTWVAGKHTYNERFVVYTKFLGAVKVPTP